MDLFAYVTASRHITTIHHFSRISAKIGEPTTQWDDWKFATEMDWEDVGVRTTELLPHLFNCATPILVLVKFEEVLKYLDNNPQLDCIPILPAG